MAESRVMRKQNWQTRLRTSERRWLLYFAAITAVLMFSPAARVLVVLVPLGALLLGFRLLRRDKAAYIELLCWLYITSPFIRRVVDFHSGGTEQVILAAPLAMLLAPTVFLLARWNRVLHRGSAPFGYILLALLYGSLLSCLSFAFSGLLAEAPIWILQLGLGLYLYTERRDVGRLYAGFERAMVLGTVFTGCYGLVQYFLLPAWDAAWMQNSEMVTIGVPEPLQVRVFSTLNAPQVLGAYLVVGILVAYRSKLALRWVAVLSGFLSLALSSARAAWIALAVGILYLAFRSSAKERARVVVFIGGCACMLLLAMSIPAVNETLSARFSSLSSGASDDSAADRRETYTMLASSLAVQPFGQGIGVESKLSDAKHDSTIVNLLSSLGGFGCLIFVVGFAQMLARTLRPGALRSMPFLLTLQAVLVALVAEAPLDNIVGGPVAFLTWSGLGLGLATVDWAAVHAAPAKMRSALMLPSASP